MHKYTSTAVLIDGPAYGYRYYYRWKYTSSNGKGTDPKTFADICSRSLLDMACNFSFSKRSCAKNTKVAVCFDQGDGGRRAYFPDYKKHRDTKSRGPEVKIFFDAIVEETKRRTGLVLPSQHLTSLDAEADDMIATLAVFCKVHKMPCLIMSHDFDLLQQLDEAKGCYFYDPKTRGLLHTDDVIEKVGVPPNQVHDFKSLVGDISDGVPGVPRIGKRTGAKLFKEFGSLNAIIKAADANVKNKKTSSAKWRSIHDSAEAIELSRRLVTPVDCPALVPVFQAFLEASPEDACS
jgi:DNA polymerase-1